MANERMNDPKRTTPSAEVGKDRAADQKKADKRTEHPANTDDVQEDQMTDDRFQATDN